MSARDGNQHALSPPISVRSDDQYSLKRPMMSARDGNQHALSPPMSVRNENQNS